MYRLIRYIRMNSRKILIAIIAIVLFIAALKTLDNIVYKNNQERKNSTANQVTNNIKNKGSDVGKQTNYAVITDTTISDATNKNNNKILKTFISYCNEKQYEKAYDMLSDECKEKVFSGDINSFIKSYIGSKFKIEREYSAQNWISTAITDTYYVKFMEDALISGNSSTNNVYDYITILSDSLKINVGSYISTISINKIFTERNVSIVVESVDRYIDYEIYNIKINNKSDLTFCLDPFEDNRSTYIKGYNDVKYHAFLNEVGRDSLIVNRYTSRNLQIKFNKVYNTTIQIKQMNFEKVIYNYQNDTKNYSNIEIEF